MTPGLPLAPVQDPAVPSYMYASGVQKLHFSRTDRAVQVCVWVGGCGCGCTCVRGCVGVWVFVHVCACVCACLCVCVCVFRVCGFVLHQGLASGPMLAQKSTQPSAGVKG